MSWGCWAVLGSAGSGCFSRNQISNSDPPEELNTSQWVFTLLQLDPPWPCWQTLWLWGFAHLFSCLVQRVNPLVHPTLHRLTSNLSMTAPITAPIHTFKLSTTLNEQTWHFFFKLSQNAYPSPRSFLEWLEILNQDCNQAHILLSLAAITAWTGTFSLLTLTRRVTWGGYVESWEGGVGSQAAGHLAWAGCLTALDLKVFFHWVLQISLL